MQRAPDSRRARRGAAEGSKDGGHLQVTQGLPAGLAAWHMKATQQEDSLETRSGDFADVN